MTTNDTVDMFTTLQKRLEEARADKGVSMADVGMDWPVAPFAS